MNFNSIFKIMMHHNKTTFSFLYSNINMAFNCKALSTLTGHIDYLKSIIQLHNNHIASAFDIYNNYLYIYITFIKKNNL